MVVFFESPWPFLIMGLCLFGMLVFVWMNTRHSGALFGMLGVVVVTTVLLGVERWVVTYSEEIEATMFAAGRALESNDREALLAHIAPDAAELREMATRYADQVTVSKVTVKPNITVELNRMTAVPQATVIVNMIFSGQGQGVDADKFPLVFKAVVRKEGDAWLFTNNFRGGLQINRKKVLGDSEELEDNGSIYDGFKEY